MGVKNIHNAGSATAKAAALSWTRSYVYEVLRTWVIILDVMTLFAEVNHAWTVALHDHDKSRTGIADTMTYVVLADLFCILFIVDLVLRLMAGYADGSAGEWVFTNILVVSISSMQATGQHLFKNQRSFSTFRIVVSNLNMIRVVRALQIVQMVPAVRTHPFFRELRVMVYSLSSAMQSLAWSAVLMLVVLYLFGITLCEGALAKYIRTDDDDWNENLDDMVFYFGSMWASCFSLFKSVTGGEDWGAIFDSLYELGVWHRFVFIVFIAFVYFAVLNVVAAVFLESTMLRTSSDRELLVQDELRGKMDFLDTMYHMFKELDLNDNGEISLTELQDMLEDPRVGAYFNTLGVDADSAAKLVDLLDEDGSGSVDEEEFIFGCLRLKGGARAIDTMATQKFLEKSMDVIDSRLHMILHMLPQVQPYGGLDQFRPPWSPRGASKIKVLREL